MFLFIGAQILFELLDRFMIAMLFLWDIASDKEQICFSAPPIPRDVVI